MAGTEVALLQGVFNGVITTRHVLWHGPTIVREFGAAAYLRCCMAILLRRKTTFLNCVVEIAD